MSRARLRTSTSRPVRARTSGLAWWAASGRPPSAGQRGERAADGGVGEQRRRGPTATSPVAPSRTRARPSSADRPSSPAHAAGAAASGRVPGQRRSSTAAAVGRRSRATSTSASSTVGLDGRRPEVGVEGLGQAIEERVELEELEEAPHLVDVDRALVPDDVPDRAVERHVADEHHELEVLAHVGLVGGEVLAELRRLRRRGARRSRRGRRRW